MGSEIRLFTDAWYSDREVTLLAPAHWEVTQYSPDTPAPLTDAQIIESLTHPMAQPPLRQLCLGKKRPLIIIDDLNRPTPTDRLLPLLLHEFAKAGIDPENVRILLASGTHDPPAAAAVRRKLGAQAASACRVLLHDPERDCHPVGITSFGTPVTVNAEVLASDFVVGIGGIYPNHTAGFGGGSKLALGVLGMRSIMHLHYRHSGVGWGSVSTENAFRKDLNEIAGMVKLRTTIAVHVNAHREVIRAVCGDPVRFHDQEARFARQVFSAPPPDGADVIISNAYPSDLSLTFARMKGMLPIRASAPGASRIAIASCRDGIGIHGLFPLQRLPNPGLHAIRLVIAMGPSQLIRKAVGRFRRKVHISHSNPVWLFRPIDAPCALPLSAGMQIATRWSDVLDAVAREQAGKRKLRVAVYSCAPLQYLDPALLLDPHARDREESEILITRTT